MPMVKWRVEPTAITRIGGENTLNRKAAAVELTDITNCIFTNVIRQLSCMCRQSKEMFDELQEMASATVLRTNTLTKRVHTLKEMASKLNPTVEEVSLDDIGAYKPFKSNPTKDPSFSHQRPKAVVDVYNSGQPVPAFSKLNQFRDDGKDCVKLYTNPDFFFELWSNQIKKEVKEKKPKRKKQQAQQAALTIRAPTNARLAELINKVERENAPPPIKPKPGQPPTPTTVKPPSPLDGRSAPPPQPGDPPGPPLNMRRQGSTSGRPAAPVAQRGARSSTASNRPNIAPPPPPPPLLGNSAATGREASRDSVLPPPPPSPPAINGRVESGGDMEEADSMPPPPVLRPPANRGTLYSVGDFDRNTAFFPLPPEPLLPPTIPQPPPAPATGGSLAPAPPPPPPPPGPPPPVTQVAPPPTTGSILPIPGSAFQLRAVAPVQKKRESRGDLLNAIRSGITLRKVEETETLEVKQPAGGGLFDVQTILEMRRKAMEEDSDEEEDDTNWDEY